VWLTAADRKSHHNTFLLFVFIQIRYVVSPILCISSFLSIYATVYSASSASCLKEMEVNRFVVFASGLSSPLILPPCLLHVVFAGNK
jgi:hypothetical protein